MTSKTTASRYTVVPPTIINFQDDDSNDSFVIEYSIHKCPNLLKSDMKNIFPKMKQHFDKYQLYIIPTFQPVSCSLFVFDENSEKEKDDKLKRFLRFSEKLKTFIEQQSMNDSKNDLMWCDYTDPVTGYPVLSDRGGMLYSDTHFTSFVENASLSCNLFYHLSS
ncbi:hypothetical protein C9374_000109 [Naegleria lovaniensis]|uniref:Uncharacterized protein n=1 Tax=Naegleria lovaniensis TaxID=51637 RepID=A0AA88GTM8_NAELO|nr:uncharacterized protein C9374_000109 [Naegleria lovaniensis]KAG2388670.1 hypothetical protein C9374_000109 [Naegleria lovaniensis]